MMLKSHTKKFIIKGEVTSDPKYEEINSLFERIFIRKGYYTRDFFDEKVWFLKEEDTIYFNGLKSAKGKILNEVNTPEKLNPLIEIILNLNEIKQDNSKNAIKVNVGKFIYKICEILIESNKIITRSKDTIKFYNAHQKVNMINENLKILNEKIKKTVSQNFSSNFGISMKKLENFPIGEYLFDLKVLEFTPLNNQIAEGKNPLSPTSSNSMIRSKILPIKETVKIVQDNEVIHIKQSKFTFPNSDFKIFDNKLFEELFRGHSPSTHSAYSGTTFSNFKIKCLRKYKDEQFTYETNIEYFLDLLLIYIEDIYDMSQDIINKTLHFKFINKEPNDPNMGISVEMNLEFDYLTRSAVLRRVNEIFTGVIETQRINENIIDEVLDEYFPDAADQIKTGILYKTKEENKEPCCGGCNIY